VEQGRKQGESKDGTGRFVEWTTRHPSKDREFESILQHKPNTLVENGNWNPSKDSRRFDMLE